MSNIIEYDDKIIGTVKNISEYLLYKNTFYDNEEEYFEKVNYLIDKLKQDKTNDLIYIFENVMGDFDYKVIEL